MMTLKFRVSVITNRLTTSRGIEPGRLLLALYADQGAIGFANFLPDT
ncbi:hypothetical protein Mal48_17550 [Thalassoglobus polymorphus]|uniref:Uncharacterized protein n=1 Tax=Thalassoglobus polymorphus TaxID=2527994 RepID=A0A517QLJ6_9PLAN|nr:hypothetical protein Mal48_17550 [Thalassoglobus polymorphus]